MAKAVIMKTKGIVSVNGKNAKPGKFLVDEDVIKTGPESFVAWIDVKDKTTLKMQGNQTFTFTDNLEEMRADVEANYGGTVPGSQLVATAKRSGAEADTREFVIQNATGVAGVKG
jgi:hypothetical protein